MQHVLFDIEEEIWETRDGFDEWMALCEELFEKTIKKVYQGSRAFSVNLLLTDSSEIRDLNRNFRGKDSSTNVLSFPQFESCDICKIDTLSDSDIIEVGDIAMSYSDIVLESEKFRIPFFKRCSHLFVHGILHLFGYDHMNQEEMEVMENLEIDILKKFGIENPYILKGDDE